MLQTRRWVYKPVATATLFLASSLSSTDPCALSLHPIFVKAALLIPVGQLAV